ncbi:MAG TPA: hypothetical protein VE553_01940, partial [Candidatus Binatia bacterium]|nr:hypothetical protein [Candidatus Binatia bacterium]
MNSIAVDPLDRVINALDELTDENPQLSAAVDFFEEVLPLIDRLRPSLHGLQLDVKEAQVKLRQGVPLLWGEFSMAPGTEPNMELFVTLCRLAAEGGNEDGDVLVRAVLDGTVDLGQITAMALRLERGELATIARSLDVELGT